MFRQSVFSLQKIQSRSRSRSYFKQWCCLSQLPHHHDFLFKVDRKMLAINSLVTKVHRSGFSGLNSPKDLNKCCKTNFLTLNKSSCRSSCKQGKCFLCTKTNHQPVLTLYTKDPCPLCEEALDVLAPHLDQVVLEKVDITKPENRQWWNEYKYDIPVFHLDGKFLMKHKANINVFLNALNNKTNHQK